MDLFHICLNRRQIHEPILEKAVDHFHTFSAVGIDLDFPGFILSVLAQRFTQPLEMTDNLSLFIPLEGIHHRKNQRIGLIEKRFLQGTSLEVPHIDEYVSFF